MLTTRARPRLLASALTATATSVFARGAPATAQSRPPDIIVIVTDDMRDADWQALSQTRAILGERGTTFPNFTCATPLCSPSRVSLLTGQYSHNHGVLGNHRETGGWDRFVDSGLDAETIQVPLHEAGYRTALIGKFINGAPAAGQVPPAWDTWYCQIDQQYHGPTINDQGRQRDFGEQKYSTDLLRDRAVAFIQSTPRGKPLFLHFSPVAPHNPPTPAARHAKAFKRANLGNNLAINESDVSDKPQYLRSRPPLSGTTRKALNQLHRDRLRTLLAVDDAIESIWSALRSAGRAENAYVFVVSDNGFLLGHHRHTGKTVPYDLATRLRMVASGPAFAAGAVDRRLASMVDLVPTIADIAALNVPEVDGVSLLQSHSRDETLLEWLGSEAPDRADRLVSSHSPSYAALRTRTQLYVEYGTGERELYNYDDDPNELDNLLADWEGHVPSPAAEAAAAMLAARLDDLRTCAGATCRPG